MEAIPRRHLRELVGTYGRELARDPRRVRALLLDVCGSYRKEVNLLVACAEEDAANDLIAASDATPMGTVVTRLALRLEENKGLAPDSARWAVESWAIALGRLDESDGVAGDHPPQGEGSPTGGAPPPPRRRAERGAPVPEVTETAYTEEFERSADRSTVAVPARAGRRAAAAIVDGMCVLALSYATWATYGSLTDSTAEYVEVARVINPLLAIAWFVVGESWDGQTLGKMLLRIRVVRAVDGSRPGPLRVLARNLVSQVSALVLMFGYLWMLWSRERTTWHDLATATRVVRA